MLRNKKFSYLRSEYIYIVFYIKAILGTKTKVAVGAVVGLVLSGGFIGLLAGAAVGYAYGKWCESREQNKDFKHMLSGAKMPEGVKPASSPSPGTAVSLDLSIVAGPAAGAEASASAGAARGG